MKLPQLIRDQFRLDWWGPHGVPHWARVFENGLEIAERNGADLAVVELFALFHDSCRLNDADDPDHGRRAADLAFEMRDALGVSARQLEQLIEACRDHSAGRLSDDATIQTCWDADRLDLGRFGIEPRAEYLSAAARDTIGAATQRARTGFVSDLVHAEWQTIDPGGRPHPRTERQSAVAAEINGLTRVFVDSCDTFASRLTETLAAADLALALARRGDIDPARRIRAVYMNGGLAALERLQDAIALQRCKAVLDELCALTLNYTDDYRISEPTLALRVCGPRMEALVDRSFVWPTSGTVTAPDYNPEPIDDERGLYALLWGRNETKPAPMHETMRDDQGMTDCAPRAKWMALRIDEGVKLPEGGVHAGDHGRWIKFGRAEVLHVGDGIGPESFANTVEWVTANANRI